jgi:hypothetical protein
MNNVEAQAGNIGGAYDVAVCWGPHDGMSVVCLSSRGEVNATNCYGTDGHWDPFSTPVPGWNFDNVAIGPE